MAGPKKTVLVVEDNEQNLELVQFLLEEAGFQVVAARDPTAARAAFRTSMPDIVLMDMHLPGRDGMSLVKEFRLDPLGGDVPIVALTAHAMRGDRERFLAGGCTGYIPKPIDAGTFAGEVTRHLGQRAK